MSAIQKKFKQKLEKAFAKKATQQDYAALTAFIRKQKKVKNVNACIDYFNGASAVYASTMPGDRRVQVTASTLLEQRIAIAPERDDEVDRLLGELHSDSQPFTRLRACYATVADYDKPDIERRLRDRAKAKKDKSSVITELEGRYRRAKERAPEEDDLDTFDPIPSESLRKEYDEKRKAIETAYEDAIRTMDKTTLEAIKTALDDFRTWANGKARDSLELFQLLRYWRSDHIKPKWVEPARPFEQAVYVLLATSLLRYAAVTKLYRHNMQGFTEKERRFIHKPLKGSVAPLYAAYCKDIIDNYMKEAKVVEKCELMLVMHVWGRKRGVRLATKSELTEVVKALRDGDPAKLKERKYVVPIRRGRAVRVSGTYRMGDVIGPESSAGSFVIAYLEKDSPRDLYVEFVQLPGALYVMHGDKFEGEVESLGWDYLFEYTKHLLVLIPLFFEVLTWIPTLVSGGFLGLVKELVVDYVIEKTVDASGLGGDGGALMSVLNPKKAGKAARRMADDAADDAARAVGKDARGTAFRAELGRLGDGAVPTRTKSKFGYRASDVLSSDDVRALQREGWTFEAVPMRKLRKSGWGRHQYDVTKNEWEIQITSPSGIKVKADGMSIDDIDGLEILEAKAGFVADLAKSGHVVFGASKVKQIAKQLALVAESGGRIKGVVIVCNSRQVAEIYTGLTLGELAKVGDKIKAVMKKDFKKQLVAMLRKEGKNVARIKNADVDDLIDKYVSFNFPD